MAPKFSEIFSFLTILKESIQILLKIWKFVVPITVFTLALTSLVVFIFTYSFQTLLQGITTQNPDSDAEFRYLLIIISLLGVILLAVEFCCLFIVITASNVCGTSIVMASAACYTGKKYSPPELLSEAYKKARKNPMNQGSFRGGASKTVMFFAAVVGLLTGAVIGMDMINPVNVCLLFLLWVALMAFSLRSTAGRELVAVASVLEENCAEQRYEQLTQGQRLESYMLQLSTSLFLIVMALVLWLVIGNRGWQNMMIYGLIWFNLIVLVRVSTSIVNTVFYFQCKYCGEPVMEASLLGDAVV